VIDPGTNRVSGPPAAVGTGPGRLHAGLGSVWVQNTSGPNATASRIDPATRAVQQLSITGDPTVGLGHVFVLGSPYGRGPTDLYRYTPGARPAYLPGAPFPRGAAITFGAGRVWVLSYPRSRSTRTFDPIDGTAAVTPVALRPYRYGLPVGTATRFDARQPDAIAVAGHDLWIADYARGQLLHFRIG
jgi:DNA-binding beta-propeller fold protein YncE